MSSGGGGVRLRFWRRFCHAFGDGSPLTPLAAISEPRAETHGRSSMLRQALTTLLLVLAPAAGFAAAPLPEAAKGVPIAPDKGYYVKEIAGGLYWVTEGVYNTMFLTTGEGVIVVDAPPSFGDKLLKAVAEVTKEPITYVIYSHAHANHIGGAARYPASATYIAHEQTKARLEEAADPGRPA